jgi:hypothetical protein
MSKIEVDAIEPQSGTTLTIGASGDTVNIASGATITDFTSTGIDDNATSTAITINSSEQVGIGTASPDDKLHVVDSTSAELKLQTDNANNGSVIKFNRSGTDNSYIGTKGYFTGTSDNNLYLRANSGLGIQFYTNGNNERMRIDSSGNVLVGNTSYNSAIKGILLSNDGTLSCYKRCVYCLLY